MDTVAFLRKILPTTGLYVIARLTAKGFRHDVCDTIEEAAGYAQHYDQQGVSVYHACAAYRERSVDSRPKDDGSVYQQVRVHKNVRALKAFWMDLDVKPGNPAAYESQESALTGMVEFCQATNLPIPMVVSSGNGIHLYWTLDEEILPEVWKHTANGLKSLSAHHKLLADHACTADPARVLRPVGTFNRKDASAPRPVELVASAPDISHGDFTRLVGVAVAAAGLKPPVEAVRQVVAVTETINQGFAVQRDFPPCSGEKVASRCAQLAKIRDTKGAVSEPHWYAGIQLLCHSIEGDPLIHQWSSGHAEYSAGETDGKILQIRGQSLGPTLCATFNDRNPGGCDGCPFQGKISSPAQLGTQVASAPAPVVTITVNDAPVEVALPLPPAPFTRGENGGIYIEKEGITHKIYEYDCYPIELAYDEQLGYETMTLRYWLPQEGWRECTLRSSLLCRPVEFEAALRDNHIQPLIRNAMAMYADAYIRKIRESNKLRKLFKSQGWKSDDTEFVLGDKLYRQTEVVQAGFSHGTKGFLEHFKTRGVLSQWHALTSAFETPGFEAHAFMLLCGFAAPLLKLTNRQGFTVAALGPSGIGKSTMGRFLSSIYGHPDLTWIKRDDTALARMQRLGAHYTLPVYMDEITTLPAKELRALVYMISTGKGRDSMRADYTLREGAEWATILVTSTNDSLQSKLQLEKANPEAESMRLFEFRFPRRPEFQAVAEIAPNILSENYGVAGPVYIRNIVANRDQVKYDADRFINGVGDEFGMKGEERFWAWAAGAALYGGRLARHWGLIDFDPECVRPWLMGEIQRMRRNVHESRVDPVTMLADYLNEHVTQRITLTKLNAGMNIHGSKPQGELSQHYDKDTQTLWVSRKHVKFYLDSNHMNFSEVRDDLLGRGVIIDPASFKVLGAGTDYAGAQTPCWKIKADHVDLSGVLG